MRRESAGTWNAAPLTFDNLDIAVDLARERLANNPDFITKLELRGRERQLVYKTLVTTGLRKGELARSSCGISNLMPNEPS